MTPASMYKRSEHDVSFVSLSADMARTLHTMARLSNSGWREATRRKLTSELVTHGMHADRAEAAVTALLDCGKLELGRKASALPNVKMTQKERTVLMTTRFLKPPSPR